MNVAGYSYILDGSADFQYTTHFTLIKHIGWNPDPIDKIEILQKARKVIIFPEMS